MTHLKIKTCTIGLLCLIAAVSAIGMAKTTSQPQPPTTRGALVYDPIFHDFGNLLAGPILNTTFQIWKGGGCCTLTYSLSENYSYVTVYPLSGTSDGEHDNITVTIDTATLPLGHYPCAINITSDGGNGIFWANFTIVLYTQTTLSCTPTAIDYGFVPNGANATAFLTIQNLGIGTLTYTLEENAPWLQVTPTNGSSIGEPDLINVTAITNGLTPTAYETTITLTSNAGSLDIPVTMNLTGIKIIDIKAAQGKIIASLTNIGNTTIESLHWHIDVKGGIFHNINAGSAGSIPRLTPGESFTFCTGRPFYGLGRITVTIRADYAKTVVTPGRIFFNVPRLI